MNIASALKNLPKEIENVILAESNYVTRFSTISCLIFQAHDNINWAGFYIWDKDVLKVGPYQGKLGCLYINENMGVVGTSFAKDKMLIVNNVHDFSGHIACDNSSKSELTIPIKKNGQKFAIMDIDFDIYDAINDELVEIFTKIANIAIINN